MQQNTNVYVVTKIINKFNEKLKQQFFITQKISNHGNNKFILLLQKGVYPNEYMDDQEKSNATTLRKKWIKDTSQFNEYFIKNYIRSTNFRNYIFP